MDQGRNSRAKIKLNSTMNNSNKNNNKAKKILDKNQKDQIKVDILVQKSNNLVNINKKTKNQENHK